MPNEMLFRLLPRRHTNDDYSVTFRYVVGLYCSAIILLNLYVIVGTQSSLSLVCDKAMLEKLIFIV